MVIKSSPPSPSQGRGYGAPWESCMNACFTLVSEQARRSAGSVRNSASTCPAVCGKRPLHRGNRPLCERFCSPWETALRVCGDRRTTQSCVCGGTGVPFSCKRIRSSHHSGRLRRRPRQIDRHCTSLLRRRRDVGCAREALFVKVAKRVSLFNKEEGLNPPPQVSR